MAQEITQGLFNNLFQTKTPRMRSQSSSLGGLFQQQPITLGSGAMTPMSALTQRVMQSGEQLQGSIRGLFGQQKPEQAQKTAITQLIRANPNLNLNEPEGLRRMAQQAMNVPGLEMFGIKLREQADILQEKQRVAKRTEVKDLLGMEKTKADILKIQKDLKGGTKLAVTFQRAASALGFPIYQTLEEYSDSQRRAMEAYTKETGISTAAAAKESLRQEKAALRQKGKIDAARTTVRALNTVIGRLDSEKTEKPFIPSASVGGLLTWLPGSKFKDLAAQLDTIKANIGFDQLAQLKESSPTGGALGQVSNFELSSLQAVRNSLDQTQSSAQLERNARLIRDGYGEFLLSINNDPKLDKTTKREIRFMLGELGFSPNTKSKSSDIILKYSDQDAEKLVTQYQIQMNRIKDALGLEKFNFGVLNKTLKPIDVLTEVERLMVREGRIKPKGN